MARLAKRDEVIRGIAAGFPAFKVVNGENRIIGLAAAVAAPMSVTKENILADVPKSELFPLLIVRPFDVRIRDSLDVESSSFHNDLCYRKKFPHGVNAGQMGVDFVFNARSQPTFIFTMNPVVETRCAVTCLAVATPPTQLPT